MKVNKSKGFSLTELMIIVAIIGVLSLIAMPFYNDYVIRVRVAQAISESIQFKSELYETLTFNDLRTYDDDMSRHVNFKTEVIDSIDFVFPWLSRYTSGYYRINLNKDAVGLTALYPKPWMAKHIYVAFVPDGEIYFDANYSVRFATGIAGPFCGQGGISAKPEYILESVPRKYLPSGCKDGEITYTPVINGATDKFF